MNKKRVLRIWGKVISPAIPMAFAVFLGIVCFINAAVHPGVAVWPIVGAICCVIVVGGVAAILISRHLAIKRTGHWL